MKVIDATGLIAGRLATKVAKMALMGETINIVNCEKAVVSGTQHATIDRWKRMKNRTHPFHGPFISLSPDRMLRRMIYGMLPHKRQTEKSRGMQAYERIMCYISVPDSLKNQKFESITGANSDNLTVKFMTLGRISEIIKGG